MGFWFLDFSLNFELFAKFSMNSMKKNVYSYLVCYKNFKSLFSYWVEIEKSFFLLNRTCFWDRIYNIMQQEYAHGNFDKRILPGWLTIETSLGIFSKQKRKGVDRESRDKDDVLRDKNERMRIYEGIGISILPNWFDGKLGKNARCHAIAWHLSRECHANVTE